MAIWQKDNIEALYIGYFYSEEKLEEQKSNNDKIIAEALEKYPTINVRDLTEEEKKALDEGRLSAEDLALILQGKLPFDDAEDTDDTAHQQMPDTPNADITEEKITDNEDNQTIVLPNEVTDKADPAVPASPDTPTQTLPSDGNASGSNETDVFPPENTTTSVTDPPAASKPDIDKEKSNSEPESEGNSKDDIKEDTTTEEKTEQSQPDTEISNNDDEIGNLVAQMYILKAEFTAALVKLEETTLKNYNELSETEKTTGKKNEMMMDVLTTVGNMEKSCDSQVDEILKQLDILLKEDGKDASLVDAIEQAYENEKTTTKAQYINKYFK